MRMRRCPSVVAQDDVGYALTCRRYGLASKVYYGFATCCEDVALPSPKNGPLTNWATP